MSRVRDAGRGGIVVRSRNAGAGQKRSHANVVNMGYWQETARQNIVPLEWRRGGAGDSSSSKGEEALQGPERRREVKLSVCEEGESPEPTGGGGVIRSGRKEEEAARCQSGPEDVCIRCVHAFNGG